jgi:hypothetical protein
VKRRSAFDPRKYLIRIDRGDYLEVKWRLAWLRAEHPDAHIETRLAELENDRAVFQARVTLPDGGSATGWGSESAADFRDFIEKAETKAIGRALAALGFGTQFCTDFDMAEGQVVDAPVRLPSYRKTNRAAEASEPAQVAAIQQPITDRQRKFLAALAQEKGMTDEDIASEVRERFDIASLDEIDRRQASQLIDILQSRESVALAS